MSNRRSGPARAPLGFALLAGTAAGAALLWLTIEDIRSGTRSVEQVMQAQAASIADLARESGAHGFRVYGQWEDEVASRLLDNARWIARRDSLQPLRDDELARIAATHHLGRVNLFDHEGRKVATSRVEEEERLPPRHDPIDYIRPVLEGKTRELRIGFKPARFRGGSRFAVAVARRGGGAVVVNVFADSMRAILDEVRPEHAIASLGLASGVEYVAFGFDDSASLGRGGLPRVGTSDSLRFARLVPSSPPIVREIQGPRGPVYEVVRAVAMPGVADSLLRIGLDPAPLVRARVDVQRRAWTRLVLIALVGGLTVTLLLLRQRKAVLAGEVAKAREELALREREAQRTARLSAMGELAAHVAHEIRNPLNTIQIAAQGMARDGRLDASLRAQAEDVRAESRRIESIVQRFLELASPRTPQLERMDLAEAVRVAARRAEPGFVAAGLSLQVDADAVFAELDPLLVGEVLENLLRNAREAAPRGSRVTVRAGPSGREARLEVEDEGPGVAPELRERIFDLYFTTKPEGTGLGLSLVAQMCAAMRGGVRLEDAASGGARFVVHFPVWDANA